MMNVRRMLQGIALAVPVLTMALPASATTVLDDQFDSFSLGTTWQVHGPGQPELGLMSELSGTNNVLLLYSSNDVTEYRGVETISAISLTGLASLTVDTRVRPLNHGGNGSPAAVEVAILGEGGVFSSAAASNVAPGTLVWGDQYADSEGSADTKSADFNHCDFGGCDSSRRLILTIDASGTSLTVLNADDTVNAFSASNANLPISSYGAEVDIALRQLKIAGGDPVFGHVDFVTVTSTAIPEPTGLVLLGIGTLLSVTVRRHKM